MRVHQTKVAFDFRPMRLLSQLPKHRLKLSRPLPWRSCHSGCGAGKAPTNCYGYVPSLGCCHWVVLHWVVQGAMVPCARWRLLFDPPGCVSSVPAQPCSGRGMVASRHALSRFPISSPIAFMACTVPIILPRICSADHSARGSPLPEPTCIS